MKTYQEFMQLVEQIPHMTQTTASLQRSKDQRLASMRHRRHVHGELAHTADTERQAKRNLDQFA
jgi:hypothetical protein